jgi:NAD(P)-dependent dehydrogenase (short-subunit alcohol dehydrogenase family)
VSNTFIEKLFSLRGRVALVSGASRGIGMAIARGFEKAGATVIGIGTSAAPAKEPVGNLSYTQCDVTDDIGFRALCDAIYRKHNGLHVYLHAAAISLPNDHSAAAIANFDKTIDVNLKAAYRCCRTVSAYMERCGGGSIINVTSIAAVLGFPGNPGYVASKGGLRLLTKALALDLADKHIRVNNLAPGYIHTAMTDKSFRDPQRYQERLARTLLKRWGTPEDLVGAAIFLASDASAYVTGQDIFVDGGWTAKGL